MLPLSSLRLPVLTKSKYKPNELRALHTLIIFLTPEPPIELETLRYLRYLYGAQEIDLARIAGFMRR